MTEAGCNDECSHNREAAETRSSTPEMPAVSAFFSLAALAEVAAMENVHRLAVENLAALGFWGSHLTSPFSQNVDGDSDMETQIVLSGVLCDTLHSALGFMRLGSRALLFMRCYKNIYTISLCGEIAVNLAHHVFYFEDSILWLSFMSIIESLREQRSII